MSRGFEMDQSEPSTAWKPTSDWATAFKEGILFLKYLTLESGYTNNARWLASGNIYDILHPRVSSPAQTGPGFKQKKQPKDWVFVNTGKEYNGSTSGVIAWRLDTVGEYAEESCYSLLE